MHDHQVRLSVPALPQFARLARLTVAGLANRLEFTYDEVEDLRIAVGEACSLLIEAQAETTASSGAGGRIDVTFTLTGDELVIEVSGEAGTVLREQGEGLSDLILDAVVDDVQVDRAEGRVRLRKRRSPETA